MNYRPSPYAIALALALFALILAPRSLQAQVDSWLPISPEDLALKDNPASPGADAMILYRENFVDASNIHVDGDNDREYYRIKIFTQAGTKRANIEIPFFRESMNVVQIEGRTIHPDGGVVKFDGKVLETTISRRNGVKFLAKTFTLPDVQPGCIIEYKYRRQGNPNYLHDMEWIVSQDIFTREAHFSMKPYDGPTGFFPFHRSYNLPADAAMREDKPGTYTMAVHDVPPMVDEALMPSEQSLEARVEFYYSDSESDPAPAKFWAKQAKKWDGEFEHFLDKGQSLQGIVSKTVDSSDAPEVKLAKLYARAQQIRNLDAEDAKMEKELKDENIKPNSNVSDVVSHGYGHGTEINFFFAGLARAAGFQAQEVRLSPVTGQVFNPGAEDVRQLDDDVVWVSTGAKEYYLDPAARFYSFNLLPWYEQGANGLRVDKPSDVVTTPVSAETDALLARDAVLDVAADGGISGKITVDFDGLEAAILRTENRREDETGQKKNVEDLIKQWLPSGAVFAVASAGPWDQNMQPLHVEGTISITGLATATNTRLLFPADIFQERYAGVFAPEKRVNIIDFHYPYEETDHIRVNAPLGYSFNTLPNPQTINAGAAVYSLTFAQLGSTLEVKRQFMMKGTAFEVKYYPNIRAIYGKVQADDNTQILMQNRPDGGN